MYLRFWFFDSSTIRATPRRGRSLERKVYVVPIEIDREIARLKLASMGVVIDALSAEQESYLASWRHGT